MYDIVIHLDVAKEMMQRQTRGLPRVVTHSVELLMARYLKTTSSTDLAYRKSVVDVHI